jgi:soluble lytic murein transglycosylase-like protein
VKRRHVVLIASAVVVVVVATLAVYLSRQRLRRARVFRTAPAKPQPPVTGEVPGSIDQWTAQFQALEGSEKWDDLAKLLAQIAKTHPAEYANWKLQYLHARALVEADDPANASRLLQPFIAAGDPLRDLALFHLSEADEASGSRWRQTLILGYPKSLYRDQAIEEEIEHLAAAGGVKALEEFANRLRPSASTSRRRDLDSHLVELTGSIDRGIALLRASTVDDAADRVARALDKPAIIQRLNAEQLALLGDAMADHRHFDRAVAILRVALNVAAKRDEVLFAIGRSYFGDEKYAEASQTYMSGANTTRDAKWKNTFLWHAARCAQLRNDDAAGERLMTAAIAVPGRFPATAAALTQRIRTRIKQRRFTEAAADLNAIRQGWPRGHELAEASLAYAVGMLGAGNDGAALSTLNAIPRNLLEKFEPYEIEYWRARALEASNPQAAFAAYLTVVRAPVPTHFAYFARQRLDSQSLAARVGQEISVRDRQVTDLIAKQQWDAARRIETDRILLKPGSLDRLASIYRRIPAYNAVLSLQPEGFPAFPLPPDAGRMSLLMAMGLFDEAAEDVRSRWPLRPQRSALTQSLAFNRGNASRDSIYAVEVLMQSVPSDYIPQLLPEVVKELLYPRYFFDAIVEDATKYEADPTLVLSIMREESRFNPRAKSAAAARGLLQFIITTARDIGQQVGLVDLSAEDLYDPRVIIRLGAKYVATLSKELGDNRYKTAAAYNAGPKQVALWSRMAAGNGDDFFMTAISYDETKHYVRKVLNSYKRYGEIYGSAGPQGGVRMEP